MDKDDLLALLATDPDVRAAVREAVGNATDSVTVTVPGGTLKAALRPDHSYESGGILDGMGLHPELAASSRTPEPVRPPWIKRKPGERAT